MGCNHFMFSAHFLMYFSLTVLMSLVYFRLHTNIEYIQYWFSLKSKHRHKQEETFNRKCLLSVGISLFRILMLNDPNVFNA